ncbi:hypothetical protein PIB30_020316 [Stylosanthes scabra]|uniref:BHLH domain-containing protein n=1 Tax=Stylosanthes scabra TaxID=79078 RepID=A0ABU6X7K3_9FABA|nr:hypothetical protein [Stylosanthes scabra]
MRREKISQQVIALSALIPGLKKLDKASVLTDAIKYVKELKEKVKVLEEENNKKKVVFVKTDEDASSDNTSSQNSCDDGNSERSTTLQLPEVEARVSEKSVLIQIHCDRNKGMLLNIIGEIHKLHLSVTNIASFIFGSSFLHVTIVAQMEDEFSMNVKELKRRLRVGLLQYM